MTPSLAAALTGGPVLLDGGLATQLEAAGLDLTGELWSARVLAEAPGAVVDAHLAFLRAGAQVITTASYQATVAGLARFGHDGAAVLANSVGVAREAVRRYRDEVPVDRPLWIAASVGPYGASLADGSEYRGGYGLSVAELVNFHRDRVRILADAGPDVLACETIPDEREAEALLIALDGLGVPAWFSYSIAGDRTRAGQPLTGAFALAAGSDQVIAVGANCSTPADVTAAVPLAAAYGKPVVAYPNSGERWDAAARRWLPTADDPGLEVRRWVADGARLVGGCCRITPTDIAAARTALADV